MHANAVCISYSLCILVWLWWRNGTCTVVTNCSVHALRSFGSSSFFSFFLRHISTLPRLSLFGCGLSDDVPAFCVSKYRRVDCIHLQCVGDVRARWSHSPSTSLLPCHLESEYWKSKRGDQLFLEEGLHQICLSSLAELRCVSALTPFQFLSLYPTSSAAQSDLPIVHGGYSVYLSLRPQRRHFFCFLFCLSSFSDPFNVYLFIEVNSFEFY